MEVLCEELSSLLLDCVHMFVHVCVRMHTHAHAKGRQILRGTFQQTQGVASHELTMSSELESGSLPGVHGGPVSTLVLV